MIVFKSQGAQIDDKDKTITFALTADEFAEVCNAKFPAVGHVALNVGSSEHSVDKHT